ncbi:acyltransferase family protein [Devosia sp. 63-57]|uniref:acyltransferase family protein n=1 Tax=Devosia sp. 63-57 TaxID=1895751 RepID=UPI00257B7860|nr:acyltransferase family protein [Devosia sp. 63-57]
MDFLRAVSVLVVLICHLQINILPGGFVGVDVFFVISGYVVALSLLHRSFKGIADFIFGFYARRFLRIFPALILCVSVTALLTVLFVPQSWLSQAVYATGRYALFGFSNLALIWFDDGYFSPRSDFNPFTHTWSLGVEEQFYLIFPLMFLALIAPWVLRGRKALPGLAVLAIASVASLVYAWHLGNADARAAYYLLASRWWELASGVMLAVLHASYPHWRITDRWRGALAIAGLVLIGLATLYADPAHFPYPWALLPVFGAVLFLHGVAGDRPVGGKIGALLSQPVALYIGRISYSLYLWHWPMIVLFRWTVGIDGPLEIAAAIALSFAAASASYHFLETPIRRLGHRQFRFFNIAVVGAGLASIALALFTYSALFAHRDALTLSVTKDQQAWYPYAYDRPSDYTGPTFAGRTLFAVGDSHLGAYEAMLHWTTKDLKMELWARGIDDCQLARLYYPINGSDHCQALVENILSGIEAKAKPGDIVFFPTLRGHRLVDQWFHFDLEDVRGYNASEGFAESLRFAVDQNLPYFERLASKGLIILLDLPKPTMMTVPYRCADWFNRSNPICAAGDTVPRSLMLELRQPMIAALDMVAQRVPALHLWDPFPLLCPEDPCGVYDATGPLFMDGDHISGHGNQVLLPAFRAEIVSLLQGQSSTSNRG